MHMSTTSWGETVITLGVGRVTCVARRSPEYPNWTMIFHVPNTYLIARRHSTHVGGGILDRRGGFPGAATTVLGKLGILKGDTADAVLELVRIAELIEKDWGEP